MSIYPKLLKQIEQLEKEVADYPVDRFASIIAALRAAPKNSQLYFVCRHNSRRSQFAEFWAHLFNHYFGLNFQIYSAGTVAGPLAPQTTACLQQLGFSLVGGYLYWAENQGSQLKTKLWAIEGQSEQPIYAFMLCSEVEADCPYLPEAYQRFSLPYEDPSKMDGRAQAAFVYRQRAQEIGRDLFYIFSKCSQNEILR
ncbi:phosphatase [Saprospira sp. CCB-QB6]|uniref:arsenate-mycothiol transferase ArsC n=1 Tax=Saprospira sp. CCB-QB6 TaxID=3023936 RepID=UPI00234A1A57|nr:phosphatase [Saprospira sp. CCB-QB6]WCL82513.1 phosphatase [Saprospira sp. CCB-QB6]